MTFPFAPLTNQWTDAELLNAVKMNARIDAQLNAAAAAMPYGLLAANRISTTVTFSSTADFAGSASVTFTLSSRRRILLASMAIFTMVSGTNGRYLLTSGYNSGGTVTIGSVTKVGYAIPTIVAITGSAGSLGQNQMDSVLLNAGTYTAYPVVTRSAGGGTSDTCTNNSITVFDMGSN